MNNGHGNSSLKPYLGKTNSMNTTTGFKRESKGTRAGNKNKHKPGYISSQKVIIKSPVGESFSSNLKKLPID